MGQPLTPQQQIELQKHRDVYCATKQHVFLKNGKIVDPADFSIGGKRIFTIEKLINCNCPDRKKHQAGTHIIIEHEGGVNVFGSLFCSYRFRNPLCQYGNWQVEEWLCQEEAERLGIIAMLDKQKNSTMQNCPNNFNATVSNQRVAFDSEGKFRIESSPIDEMSALQNLEWQAREQELLQAGFDALRALEEG